MKRYEIEINSEVYHVTVRPIEEGQAPVQQSTAAPTEASPAPATSGAGTTVTAPMGGNVWKVEVQPGQAVKAGDVLVILEAMKMENEIIAPADGVVQAIHVNVNDAVDTDQDLVTLG